MDKVVVKARGKINIGLDIKGKREDGYHEMDMIMQTLKLYDGVTMQRTDTGILEVTSNLSYLESNESNIAYKAAVVMFDACGITDRGLKIYIDKRIPVAAGMAGGSADAAAVLIGMNRLYELDLGEDKLMELGKKIGADVPYCIAKGTKRAEGIGEKLTTLPPFPKCYVVIAKPGFSVSTRETFERYAESNDIIHPDIDLLVQDIRQKDLQAIVDHMGNVLESVTIKSYPIIDSIKKFCINHGAMGAMMTGSGPTVFAFFEDFRAAKKCCSLLRIKKMAKEVHLTEIFNTN